MTFRLMNDMHCIYCKSSLVDRYCPVCEPQHFEKLKEQFTRSETAKGAPRRPGPM